MLSMPIKEIGGEVIGVAQVINKIGTKDQRIDAFTDSDEKVSHWALVDIDGTRMYFFGGDGGKALRGQDTFS